MQSIVPTTIHNLSFLLEQEQVIHTKKYVPTFTIYHFFSNRSK